MSQELKGDSHALDSRRALKMLREAMEPQGWQLDELLSLESVKYWPGKRRTIRYRLRGVPPGESSRKLTLFGKLYRGRKGERLYRTLRHLTPCLTGTLRLPQPLGYLPRRRLLLLEALPGESLGSLLQREKGALNLESFAAVLPELHAIRRPVAELPDLRIHDGRAEEGVLGLAADRVGESDWPSTLKGRFKVLERRAVAALDSGSLHPPGLSLIHRDLYPDQVLGSGDGWGLIDLDELAWGEAELDLGNFLAHLVLDAIRGEQAEAVDTVPDLFTEAYRRGGGIVDDHRLASYKASTLLRLASLQRLAIPSQSWQTLATGLLDQAEQALSG